MSNEIKKDAIEAELDNTIKPEMIVIDDDSDMPEPETKTYENLIKCTPKFMSLFKSVVNDLPYATILKNSSGDKIKLIDLVKYVETKSDKMPVTEMDKIISFISNIEFKYARPLMEIIEDSKLQKTLWSQIK